MKEVRKALREHIKKIDLQTTTGKKEYFIKPQSKIFPEHISINIYRDEFPMYLEGRAMMDNYISHIYNYVEKEFHGKVSIVASIVYRSKRNMKNLDKYP